VEDAFLTQHVTGPTRQEALLDLVFTSELSSICPSLETVQERS
jgi:hypothetical protein